MNQNDSNDTNFTNDTTVKNGHKKKLYMIGNAHLDPVWLWRWQEGFRSEGDLPLGARPDEGIRRFRLHVQLRRNSTNGSKRNDPAMFAGDSGARGRGALADRRRLVDSAGLQYSERRVVRPAGIVRPALFQGEARRDRESRLQRRQLRPSRHAAADLKKSGMDYYVMMRPMPNEKGLPGRLFWWQSDDGSAGADVPHPVRILYVGQGAGEPCAALPRRNCKAPFDELMCFYGVGNHGGGPTQGKHRQHPPHNGSKPSCRSWYSATPNEYFDGHARRICRSRSSTTTCSTMPAAATRRTRASSSGTARRRTC